MRYLKTLAFLPNPAFTQQDYSESDFDQDIVVWIEPYANSQPTLDNSFLDLEAVESDASNNSIFIVKLCKMLCTNFVKFLRNT